MHKQTEPTASSSSDNLRFAPWSRDHADIVWPVVRPWIAAAFKRTGYDATPADAYGWIMCGNALLWICADGDAICGCVITRIVHEFGAKQLEITVLAGRMPKGWNHLEGELIQHARLMGCGSMVARARTGWARKMRPFGWRPKWVWLEKVV